MFNDKKIHYLIVAALATSFSGDAFAASRSDLDSSTNGVAEFEATEYGEGAPTRATSRGFAESTNLDTQIWNNGLVSLAPTSAMTSSSVVDTADENRCQSSASSARCSEHPANQFDLGNGRMLEVESIRFDDGAFATTLVGEHSMRPVAINLKEAIPSMTHLPLETFPSNDKQLRWSYIGRVIDSHSPSSYIHVEGELPMKVRLHNGGEMSVQIDSAALVKALS